MTDVMQNFSFRKEVYALVDKSNFTHKIIFTVLIAFMLSIAYPVLSQTLGVNNGHTNTHIAHADEKDDKKDDDKKDDDKKEDSDSDAKDKVPTSKNKWTLYAGFIMDSGAADKSGQDGAEEDKSVGDKIKGWFTKSYNGSVSGIIGDGGITVDIPYNKMYSAGWKIITPDKADSDRDNRSQEGRKLASFLSTYSYYGYIETVSGNALASESSSMISGIGRGIGAFFVGISLGVYYMMSSFISWTVDGLVALNPYRLLGFDKGATTLPDNPVSKGLSNFVEGFGFNGKLVTSITEVALMIVTFGLAWKLMSFLRKGNTGEIGSTLQRWLIRIIIVFAFFPLAGQVASSIGSTVKTINDDTQVTNAPVNKYLLDVRKWASSTNLAPTGLVTSDFPDASANTGHVDSKFAPVGDMRSKVVGNINKQSYDIMDNKHNAKEYGFDLLGRWSGNTTFNVNTYIGDLRRSSADGGNKPLKGVENFSSKYASFDKKGKHAADPGDLEYVIWSGTQNIDKNLKDPNNKNFKTYSNLGVDGNTGSFSTQSVALMLQSSFDTAGSKFYAYNIAPSGLQGNIKNASTVKTEWRQVTLPGEGVIGKFGSWLGLISESIAYVIVSVAVFVGLITTNFFAAMIRFAKRTVHAIATGSVHSAMSTVLIFLAGIVSLIIALGLPHVVLGLTDAIASGVWKATDKIIQQSGYIEIIKSLVLIGFAWYISFGTKIKGYGMTPVRLLMSLPLEAAFRYDDRVDQLNRQGNTDIKASAKTASFASGNVVKSGMRATGQHMGDSAKAAGAGAVGGATGSIRNAYKGAKLGGKAGGPWGAVAGAAGGAAIGGVKGSKDAASKAFNNSKSSVMKNQGVDDATKDSMKNARDKGQKVKKGANALINLGTGKKGAAKEAVKGLASDPKGTAAKAATLVGIGKLGKSAKELNSERQNANGVAPEKPLSKDMVIPPAMLKKSSKDSIKDKEVKQELKDLQLDSTPTGEQSQVAATNAKEMVGKDGEPMFTEEEYDTLRNSESEEQFVHNLRGTNNGEAYAMMTTSAKASLQGTQFVGEDGNVNQQAIDSFNKELDIKQTAGTLSDDDMAEKRRLDSAFIMGAKEHYANAKPSGGPSGGSDNTPPNDGGNSGAVATGSNGQRKERPKRKGNNLRNNSNNQRSNGQSARTTTSGSKPNKTYASFKNNGGGAPRGGNATKSAKQNFATQSASQTKKANTNQQQNKAMAQKQNQAQQKQAKQNQQKQADAFNKQQRKQNQQNKQMLNKQQKTHNANQKKQQQTFNKQQQKNNQQFKQNQQKQQKRQQDLNTRQNKRPQGKQANANTQSSRDKLN